MKIGVSNPIVPIFLPRVCTLVLFIIISHSLVHTLAGKYYVYVLIPMMYH